MTFVTISNTPTNNQVHPVRTLRFKDMVAFFIMPTDF